MVPQQLPWSTTGQPFVPAVISEQQPETTKAYLNPKQLGFLATSVKDSHDGGLAAVNKFPHFLSQEAYSQECQTAPVVCNTPRQSNCNYVPQLDKEGDVSTNVLSSSGTRSARILEPFSGFETKNGGSTRRRQKDLEAVSNSKYHTISSTSATSTSFEDFRRFLGSTPPGDMFPLQNDDNSESFFDISDVFVPDSNVSDITEIETDGCVSSSGALDWLVSDTAHVARKRQRRIA
jgi:hypothetical protein